ncbi:MAG: OB-fold nucleic acid binding domain-containing protein [Acidilobus sp.]
MTEENVPRKVSDLREGEDNVDIKVRVISVEPPKTIHTQRGDRTISEAIVGDETGRIKLTAWGKQAGRLQEGDAVELKGAWTTAFRGQVQLNIGSRGSIDKIDDSEVPKAEEIPQSTPTAQGGGQRPPRREFRRPYGRRSGGRGGFHPRSEEGEGGGEGGF